MVKLWYMVLSVIFISASAQGALQALKTPLMGKDTFKISVEKSGSLSKPYTKNIMRLEVKDAILLKGIFTSIVHFDTEKQQKKSRLYFESGNIQMYISVDASDNPLQLADDIQKKFQENNLKPNDFIQTWALAFALLHVKIILQDNLGLKLVKDDPNQRGAVLVIDRAALSGALTEKDVAMSYKLSDLDLNTTAENIERLYAAQCLNHEIPLGLIMDIEKGIKRIAQKIEPLRPRSYMLWYGLGGAAAFVAFMYTMMYRYHYGQFPQLQQLWIKNLPDLLKKQK